MKRQHQQRGTVFWAIFLPRLFMSFRHFTILPGRLINMNKLVEKSTEAAGSRAFGPAQSPWHHLDEHFGLVKALIYFAVWWMPLASFSRSRADDFHIKGSQRWAVNQAAALNHPHKSANFLLGSPATSMLTRGRRGYQPKRLTSQSREQILTRQRFERFH